MALPTVVLSTHTGGLGTPARLDGCRLRRWPLWSTTGQLGVEFDCIYTGYLGGEEQVALAEKAFDLWPAARKVVDPVMGDNGKAYSTVTPALIDRMRGSSAGQARPDPAQRHRGRRCCWSGSSHGPIAFDDASAQALADELTDAGPQRGGHRPTRWASTSAAQAPAATASSSKSCTSSRSFPGTGDLYGAVLIGSLIQGNALSAAADNAAEFVSLAIQQHPRRSGHPLSASGSSRLLPRLCPVSWN